MRVVHIVILAGVNKFWSLCVLKAAERHVGVTCYIGELNRFAHQSRR